MSDAYKPAGYTSVAPYIMTRGGQKMIDFLVAVFDAEPLRRLDRPDGMIMHAEVRIDDTVVMIADEAPDYPAFPVWMHVYVKDVDATYRRALAAGGEAVQAPAKKDDPDKRGGFKDPAGNTWWVATQMG